MPELLRDFIAFLNRFINYALADSSSPKGVNIRDFISAIKGLRFNNGQRQVWVEILLATHSAQRQLLIVMAYGIYCDPSSPETTRLNSIDLCSALKDTFTSDIKSDLIDYHSL
jgi:hypothetical protein